MPIQLVEDPDTGKGTYTDPSISDVISLLEQMKEKYGDLPVRGAYDGWWGTPLEIMKFENSILIGSIS